MIIDIYMLLGLEWVAGEELKEKLNSKVEEAKMQGRVLFTIPDDSVRKIQIFRIYILTSHIKEETISRISGIKTLEHLYAIVAKVTVLPEEEKPENYQQLALTKVTKEQWDRAFR